MKRILIAAALAVSSACPHGHALAQAAAWPAKPIRFVVPFGAGSPPDVVARVFSKSLSEGGGLGQPIVVENRVGAGGTIGSEMVAKSPADGYTIMLGSTSTLAITPSLYTNLPYKPTDFVPIILAATAPYFIFVHPSLNVNTVKELVDLAKAKPGQLAFGSTGNGTPLHIAGEMFKTATGTNLIHVPYKEVGPVVNDALAGRIQIVFQQLPSLLQHVKAGRLKPLAVASSTRDPHVPDVPTAREAGLPNYEVFSWFGVVAPKGTPHEAIERLNSEMNKALAQPSVRETLMKVGFDTVGGSPEQFATFITSEAAKWSSAVKASGAKVD